MVGENRTTACDRDRRLAGNSRHSVVGLLAYRSHAGGGRIFDAVHGAGSVGSVSGPPDGLSPPEVRGTFPGLAYQLGNLVSSRNGVIQGKLVENRYGGMYPPVLAGAVGVVA